MRAALVLAIFICGILIGFQTPSLMAAGGVLIIGIGILCAEFFVKRSPHNMLLRQRLGLSGIVFLIFGTGILDGSLNYFNNEGITDGEQRNVTGIVDSRRTLSSSEMYRIQLRAIDDIKERGELTLFTRADKIFSPGDIVSFRASLSIDSTASPLQRKLIASGYDDESIGKVGESISLRYFFLTIRERIDRAIGSTHLNRDTKSLLRALIIADRTEIAETQTVIFRDGGIIHTLAVSGMHIAIIATILLLLTRPIAAVTGRKLRLLIILSGIWIFIMITGASYPTMRAGIMISVVTIALILERRRDPFEAVCLAALMIVAIRPASITDIGLQLSFVSVSALSLLADPLNPIDHRRHPKTYYIFSLFLTTIIATAATWMLCGYYFGSVAIRFIPSNVLILPILPFYVGASLIYLLLFSFGMELQFFTELMDAVPRLLTELLNHLSVPSLKIEVGIWNLISWMLAMSALALSLYSGRKHSIAGEFEAPPMTIHRPFLVTAILFSALSLILLFYR